MKTFLLLFIFLIVIVCVVLLFQQLGGKKWIVYKSNQFDLTERRTILYTKHALCRLKCRQITENEVKEVIVSGKINYAKSQNQNSSHRCPTYAFESQTKTGKTLRVIASSCPNESLNVITLYSLDKNKQPDLCECLADNNPTYIHDF